MEKDDDAAAAVDDGEDNSGSTTMTSEVEEGFGIDNGAVDIAAPAAGITVELTSTASVGFSPGA